MSGRRRPTASPPPRSDGTQQLVTITINGANDAAVISGVANGSVIEAGGVGNGTSGTPTATGDLSSTDIIPERAPGRR